MYKHLMKIQDTGSTAMARGNDIHKEGEAFLKQPPLKGKAKGYGVYTVPESYKNFAAEMAQLQTLNPIVESQWGFTNNWEPTSWFGSATWVRIICDVSAVYDDKTADIIDFKTGKKYDTNEEQIDLFKNGGFAMWPEVEHITARLWYLDIPDGPHDGKDPHLESTANTTIREYTRDDFEASKKAWAKKVEPMFKDRRFAPRPSNKCGWCSYSRAKGGKCKF